MASPEPETRNPEPDRRLPEPEVLSMPASIRALMSSVIDYAGLFPPAKLDMGPTVANFARYAAGEHAWMLGRLVVPVARLGELERELAKLGSSAAAAGDEAPEAWRVSALIGENLDAEIERIFEFNRAHAGEDTDLPDLDSPRARQREAASALGVVIDAIELKATSAAQIDRAMSVIPEQLEPYFEVAVGEGVDSRGLIAAMAGTGARAKIRTGGVTPEAFPPAREVARFLLACAAADVAFKATAGLHHAVRGEYNLTYEPGCARGTMYGFLNVFVAAAVVRSAIGAGERIAVDEVAAILEEPSPASFRFEDRGVAWRDRRIDVGRLTRVRESFAVSFGSCSFEEPVEELRKAGLI